MSWKPQIEIPRPRASLWVRHALKTMKEERPGEWAVLNDHYKQPFSMVTYLRKRYGSQGFSFVCRGRKVYVAYQPKPEA